MGTRTAGTGTRPARHATGAACVGLALTAGMLLAGCGAGPPGAPADTPESPAAPTTTVAAPDRAYCDTVARVQAEQASPRAGQGGVPAASAAARQQVADLEATAPPELANDWHTVAQLTERALGSLADTGGDPEKIDRDELAALQARSGPAVEHVKAVTAQRCHVVFRPTG